MIEDLKLIVCNLQFNQFSIKLFQDRYKNDMNLAIQLLRCNPENVSAPKISSVIIN